jgi:hypothetical protein
VEIKSIAEDYTTGLALRFFSRQEKSPGLKEATDCWERGRPRPQKQEAAESCGLSPYAVRTFDDSCAGTRRYQYIGFLFVDLMLRPEHLTGSGLMLDYLRIVCHTCRPIRRRERTP